MVEVVTASLPRAKRPARALVRLLVAVAVGFLIGYGGICIYLFSMQTKMIYPESQWMLPASMATQQARQVGLVPWDHPTPGAVSPQGYVSINWAQPAPRGTIVLFHGNGQWATARVGYRDAFEARGFRIFLYEYPGYGGRPGRPSEKTIVPDARALIRSLDQAGYGPIYVWGESLGSGVAASVCADETLPVHGLALLTPWDNIANVGLSIYPWLPIRLLITDRYDSIDNLRHFHHPICVIRSEEDEIIPPSLSLHLISQLPDPKLVIVHPDAGHNTWPRSSNLKWWDDALNFIAPKN
jgi:pimeloyl-ACP methyl ester carboxylesterase